MQAVSILVVSIVNVTIMDCQCDVGIASETFLPDHPLRNERCPHQETCHLLFWTRTSRKVEKEPKKSGSENSFSLMQLEWEVELVAYSVVPMGPNNSSFFPSGRVA
jgi:hypothetical protein